MFNLKNAIIPTPVKINDLGKGIKIGTVSNCKYTVLAPYDTDMVKEAVKFIEKSFNQKASCNICDNGYKITITIDKENAAFKDITSNEAYLLNVSENAALILANSEAGAYYGAISLGKIIHTLNSDVLLPKCEILDYPRFPNRGHFMECRYGSDFMTLEDWKKAIDYLAEMKINNLTIGLYGCWSRQYDGDFAEYLYIPFEKYPELKTPRKVKTYSAKYKKFTYQDDVLPTMFEDDYFGKMIEYAKKKNITVIPLFNSLGHNTLIPRVFPEISAVGEDGKNVGLGFCTNNEKTYEVMFNIYDEIIDRYLKPNGIDSFEIGLDEVWPVVGVDVNDRAKNVEPFCKCEKCRGIDYGKIMFEYIIKIAKHMKQKGIKNVYVYHDMLFNHGMLTDEYVQRLKDEDVYDVIIIDWWSYASRGYNFDKKEDEVHSKFRSIAKPFTGYFHWMIPTQLNENIYVLSEIADKNNFEGVVSYSSFEYCYDYNYNVLAECSWNGKNALSNDELIEKYAHINFPDDVQGAIKALKLIQEFSIDAYSKEGNLSQRAYEYYTYSYHRYNIEYPQDYPASAYRKIRDNEKMHIDYMENVMVKAKYAYNYFNENTSSKHGDVFKLVALTYLALCDEFYTVYTLSKKYNSNEIDESYFVSELNRLIVQREKTISLCEDVRIKANQNIAIRDMAIEKQMLIDLRDYMKEEIKKGNKPQVDIFTYGKYLSDISKFLR